jgi:hypothetical protein
VSWATIGVAQPSLENSDAVDFVGASENAIPYNAHLNVPNLPSASAALIIVAENYDPTEDFTVSANIYGKFDVILKNQFGQLNAVYDKNGYLESYVGYFDNVALPKYLQQKLVNDYEGWTMVSNRLVTVYEQFTITSNTYRIKLRKGNSKKTVVLRSTDTKRTMGRTRGTFHGFLVFGYGLTSP